MKAAYCAAPSIVRAGSFSAARQAGGTGFRSPGARSANASRTACGAVGARSPPHTPFALALRNERSSRKKSSRCLPQRNAAIEAEPWRVRNGRVVAERRHARSEDRLAVLGSGEVVDELVVVPVAVQRRGGAERPQRREVEPEPVLPPLLRDGARDRSSAHLAVGVDRVADVQVEVVPLRRHAGVDPERVEGRPSARPRGRVRVAGDREAHGRAAAGGGAVSNDPAALTRAPCRKRYVYLVAGRKPVTRHTRVRSFAGDARRPRRRSTRDPWRAAASTTPRTGARAQRIADVDVTSPAATPYRKPGVAAPAPMTAVASTRSASSETQRCMRRV